MNILILESISGIDFSYHAKQVVEKVDPVTGADLVKHKKAVELDDNGQRIEPVAEPAQAEGDDETGDESEEESEEEETPEGDEETANVEESEKEETANVEETAETAIKPPKKSTRTGK